MRKKSEAVGMATNVVVTENVQNLHTKSHTQIQASQKQGICILLAQRRTNTYFAKPKSYRLLKVLIKGHRITAFMFLMWAHIIVILIIIIVWKCRFDRRIFVTNSHFTVDKSHEMWYFILFIAYLYLQMKIIHHSYMLAFVCPLIIPYVLCRPGNVLTLATIIYYTYIYVT